MTDIGSPKENDFAASLERAGNSALAHRQSDHTPTEADKCRPDRLLP